MALRGVLDHPKFGALKSLLRLNKYATLGLLEALWHFTARYTPAGNIGKYTDQEIAIWLEWPGDATALISALIASRWIDTEPHFRLIVHDWPDSADEAVHGQLARRLERFANGELPRTRRLNSGERKKYNDAVVAGEVIVRERMVPSIPAMTVQGALPSRAGYVQGSDDARSVLSLPCTTIAVPVPVPVPEPVPAPVPEPVHSKAYRVRLEKQTPAHPISESRSNQPSDRISGVKNKPHVRAKKSRPASWSPRTGFTQ